MKNEKILTIKKFAENKNCKIFNFKQISKHLEDAKLNKLINLSSKKSKEYIEQQRFNEAEILITQALKVKQDFRLRQYLVIVKMYLKKYEEAALLCRQNIKKHKFSEDYNNLSLIYRAKHDYKTALKYGKKAVDLKPNSAAISANYAITAAACNDMDLAIEYASKSIEIDPSNPMFYANKGSMYAQINKMEEAKKNYESAMRFNPNEPQVYIDYFYCMANMKNYTKAWPFYEMRYERIKELKENIIKLKRPILRLKKPFYEENICVIPEQGLGDSLMALRFMKQFQDRAPNSYFYSSEQLYPFAKAMGIRVKSKFDRKSSHVVGIMSLPFHLGLGKIPEPASPILHNKTKSDKLRIGLCWAGSPFHPLDSQRSTYLKWYSKFLSDKNMQVFSFMKDRRARIYVNNPVEVDFSEGFADYKITDLSDKMMNALTTAKLFDNIDVLVTVDTFVAHLAGSCGVPTYIIIGDNPDWRWGRQGETTEWYPTVRLVRKSKNQNMKTVINQIYKKIKDGELPPSF